MFLWTVFDTALMCVVICCLWTVFDTALMCVVGILMSPVDSF